MKAAPVALALVVALLAGIFGGTPPARALDLTGAHGGDLRVALQGFGGLDPRAASLADRTVLELVYDSLGRADPVTLELKPWAAATWSWDNDKNITVTLRTGVMWSDGTAYDANDVAYALSQYKVGGVSRWQIAVPDARTLRFDFTSLAAGEAGPGLFFTEGLTAFIAWDRNGTNRFSGPFSRQSFTPGSPGQLVLAANPYHFSGRPNLDTVTYKWPYAFDYGPNNTTKANDAACALLFRDVHLIGWSLVANDISNTRDCRANWGGWWNGTAYVNKSLGSLDPATSEPFAKIAKNPGNDFMYLGFTFSGGSFFVGPLGSPGQELRSAIQLLVNKGLYKNIEAYTSVTHSVVNGQNLPWAPDDCSPYSPCPFIVDASTQVAPSPVRQKTNTDPAAFALDAGGLVDRNGDGVRETPGGVPLAFRLLTPSFPLDPRKNTIANDLLFQLRAVDLVATLEAHETWASLRENATSCSACLYVARYSQATQSPDWLYTMPELRASGDTDLENYLAAGANASFTQDARALNVGRATHVVGENADVVSVVSYFDLQAFDADTFSGWVNILGGINNFWSFKDLRLPRVTDGEMAAAMSIFPRLGLMPGQTTSVQLTILDAVGRGVPNATVEVAAPVGSLSPASGATDFNGIFAATYTAPSAVAAPTDVKITAEAAKEGYVGATASSSLTVHPAAPSELAVAVSRGSAPEIASGASATITVEVTDAATLQPVPNANVTLRTDLPGATITPASGQTDATGIFTANFAAAVKQGVQYQITADVTKPEYAPGSSHAFISVASNPGNVTVADSKRNVPGFDAVFAIGAVASVFAAMAVARRRKGR